MATFVYVIHISSTAERLWHALTGPEFVLRYWAGRMVLSDWQVGSPLTMTKNDGSVNWYGEVLEYTPPKRLAFTFSVPSNDARLPKTSVSFDISEHDSIAQLTVSHDGYENDAESFKGVSRGWPMILSELKFGLERAPMQYAWRG